jgi:hypothetical protein
MAVLVTVVWIRSNTYANEIRVDFGDGFYGVSIIRGYLIVFSRFRNPKGDVILWTNNNNPPMPEVTYEFLPLWNFENYKEDGGAIRLWLFAVPLTLLSAYLILRKPRKRV